MEWDLRALRHLVAAAETGTFTDAAIELGVSQAAVSRTIAGLEESVGARLMLRTRRGCEPTALGRRVLPQARRVLAEAARFDEMIRSEESTLRLGYAWAAAGRHTTPLLRGWARDHPAVTLRLVRHNTVTAGLDEGLCDAAIVRTPLDERRFEAVSVGLERRMVAFAADDADWARRRTIRMAEIAARPVLVDTRTGTTVPELWPEGARPTVLSRTSDVEEWLDAIAAGAGIGTTSEATAAHNPRPGVAYRPVSDGPAISVRLAWRRDDPPPGLSGLVTALTALYRAPA
ncbi:LysR family transcriptional regulator [Microbacterium betulae]|uniref:LysR family transcriptional regulator n=1 Tax=Microbacterium betulae TaxID=2981139 RepID=A0AA97FHI2_9MICO|nr:LysR family transcriptional regulator [Microbacterium sp. AB]WOF22654.1 LysR family transcriptional regulator [Microbacterium sp. AB]